MDTTNVDCGLQAAAANGLPAVRVEGAVGENVLLPGLVREVVPGRAVVVHDECRVAPTFQFSEVPFRRAGGDAA